MVEAYLLAANMKILPIFQRMKSIRGSYIYIGGQRIKIYQKYKIVEFFLILSRKN